MHIDNPDMAIVEVVQGASNGVALQLPLCEFLECFTPPQSAKIVEGSNKEFDAHEAFDIPRGSSLVFHRKVNPNVPVTFQDTWGGGASRHWNKITLPVEFPGRFRLMPFDPDTGDTSADHIHHTTSDLVKAFPNYVQANASFGDKLSEPNCSFDCGDRLKLIRLIFKNGQKFMECKLLGEPRLLHLPMHCIGDFTVVNDNNTYLLADILSMLPRRRRVRIANDSARQAIKIPGIPQNYDGDLYIEEPETFIEATPVNDPGLIIGLPCDLEMMVSPDEPSVDRGQLLTSFATQNRNAFPVVARVTDWAEETSILENHFVKPGIEIVIHGWTRQSKVLAISGESHFAIPLTYTGKFRIKPKQYHGVSELERAYPGNKLQVIQVDHDDVSFPLNRGDIIKIKREDTLKRKSFREVEIRCEKYDSNGKLKDLKLPLMSTAIFEEHLEDAKNSYTIKELVSFVSDQELMVECTQKSPDQKSPDRDIPGGRGILLCDFVIEPAVYVSVETPEAPAFHIPLRTLIHLMFVFQLERSASPLLTKRNPRLSTLDRCVEIVSAEVFDSLRPQRALENTQSFGRATAQTPTNGWAPDGGSTTGWPAALGATREFDLLSGKSRKPPSVAGSDIAINKSKGVSRLKSKFRRHKSQENLFGGGLGSASSKSDLAPLSLPKQEVEYARSVTNDNIILAERSVSVRNGKLHVSTQENYGKGGGYVSESSVDANGEGSQSVSSSSTPQSPSSSDVPVHTVNMTSRAPVTHPQPPQAHAPAAAVTLTSAQRSGGSAPLQNGLNGHRKSPDYPSAPQPAAQAPPGYALVSMQTGVNGTGNGNPFSGPQTPTGSPGYVLVPVMSPDMVPNMPQTFRKQSVSSSDSEEEFSGSGKDFNLKKMKFKVTIPPDGNLYHFSTKKMGEFLQLLRIEDQFVQNCVKQKIDGKKFSRLEASDLQKLGIMHPIVVHFRKLTQKKKQKFML